MEARDKASVPSLLDTQNDVSSDSDNDSESEDEEDFQNTNVDKYVNLNKIVLFECKFHRKFKKWYPITNNLNNSRIVHINKLVTDYY